MSTKDALLLTTLTNEYVAIGFNPADAREEAAREVRLTTGDPYFGRSDDELAEMEQIEAEQREQAARTAGVCDEFPDGEFAVQGYNYDIDWSDEA